MAETPLFLPQLLEKLKYSRVEKIKTIGATYMAAAGLTGVDGQNQHIISMARFAFEIQKKLDNINRHSFNEFQLRIGEFTRFNIDS